MRVSNIAIAAGWVVALLTSAASAAAPAGTESPEALSKAFVAPPASARPWVYWFWSDGNLNRKGITADLEAMRRVGIGGVLIMEVDQGIPPGPARFMSPEWRDLVRHVLKEAARLGIEINLNNDGGWCGSGGPWVAPEHAMQRVALTETVVRGPGRWKGSLRRPPAVAGYYRDIAVLAIPSPDTPDPKMADAKASLLSGGDGKRVGAAPLLDGDPETSMPMSNPSPDKPHVLSLEFAQPVSVRALTLQMATWNSACDVELLWSSDGAAYRSVRTISARWPQTSVNFPQIQSRHFRLVIKSFSPPWAGGFALGDVALHAGPRIEELAGKAGYVRQDVFAPPTPSAGLEAAGVSRTRLVDLSATMDAAGRLAWEVPDGTWTILRIGHTPTGAKNAPAPKESIGLECDKLSKEAVEAHFEGFVGKIADDQKSLGIGPMVSTHIDSWEVGSQNWTPRLPEEFRKRRGYDLRTMLPVFSGRVVENVDTTERFLFDLRRTLGELVAENYAGHMRELAQRRGLRLSIEAYGDCVFDQLAYAGRCDEPMCEFWVGGGALELAKAMSSAAHAYGRPIVGAEAFTAADTVGKWQNHPFSLKALGDAAFCSGVNRFVFHRYAMQPWLDRKPGMTMGPWGTHYERTVTWWEHSPAWHQYLSRCQHLLRQGTFVADLCYLQSEAMPNGLYHAPRSSYDFDGCPPELLQSMHVRDGRLVLPSGMQYRLLVLPPVETMTPALLTKIRDLVAEGAAVLGPRPSRSPSLTDHPRCDDHVRRLAAELWGDVDGKKSFQRRFGLGRIMSGKTPEEVLAGMGVPPDFRSDSAAGSGGLRAIHRRVGETDLYFVANGGPKPVADHCTFRVRGRRPEFWHPETGRIEPVAVYEETADVTRIPLRLEPSGSVFVVFRGDMPPLSNRAVALLRDGTPIVQADPKATIVVTKAIYGAPGDDARSRDVTAEVQRRVQRGERSFPVVAMAVGGDPAVGVVKTLRVQYAVDGAARVSTATDLDTLHLAAHRFVIAVDKAMYGVLDDAARSRDVTAYVRQRVQRRECSFPVASMAQYGDPAFMVVKTLRIEYRVDGKPQFAAATDPEDIVLQVPSPPPAAEIHVGDDGRLVVEAAQPGRFELQAQSGTVHRFTIDALPKPVVLAGPWDVRFAPGGGAPERITLEPLRSWSEHADPRVKYYSGSATYTKSLDAPAEFFGKNRRVWLDLGDVRVIAGVTLNGRGLAPTANCLWKPPFRLDVTGALRPGPNQLAVEVVNLWPNRLIGDEQLPDDCVWQGSQLKEYPRWLVEGRPSPTGRLTFATWKHYRKDSPLLPSGLLGPVTLLPTQTVPID